jgi:predicted transcriptional regulator of viral defense system
MPSAIQHRLLDLIRTAGIFRARDLNEHGIAREHLHRLSARGLVERIGRGLYRVPDLASSEHQALAEACKRVPRGVICLLSALRFHGLTTQNPFEVWLAIDRKARLPKVETPPLRILRFSGQALTAGIEEHWIQGIRVRIYGPAKTVADCFKYRNKLGVDVAIEAAQDCVRQERCTFDEIWKFAKICRVSGIMRPYLESLG